MKRKKKHRTVVDVIAAFEQDIKKRGLVDVLTPKTLEGQKALIDYYDCRAYGYRQIPAQSAQSSMTYNGGPDDLVVEGIPFPVYSFSLMQETDLIDVTSIGSQWYEYKAGAKGTTLRFDMQDVWVDVVREKISPEADRAIFAGDLISIDQTGKVTVATTLDLPIGIAIMDSANANGTTRIHIGGFKHEPIPDVQLLLQPRFLTDGEHAIISNRYKRDYEHVWETGVWREAGREEEMSKSLTAATIQTIYDNQPAEMTIELEDGNEIPVDIYPVKVDWGDNKTDKATVTYAIKSVAELCSLIRQAKAAWFIPTTFALNNGKLLLGKPIPAQRIGTDAFLTGSKDGMTVLRVDIWEGELCFTSSQTTKT